jgi:hypothetical protein
MENINLVIPGHDGRRGRKPGAWHFQVGRRPFVVVEGVVVEVPAVARALVEDVELVLEHDCGGAIG